jgi:hypothetical protein
LITSEKRAPFVALSTAEFTAEEVNTSNEGNSMARKLDGKKVAILVADGFEQVEND